MINNNRGADMQQENKIPFSFNSNLFKVSAEEVIATRKEIDRLANLLIEMREEDAAIQKHHNEKEV